MRDAHRLVAPGGVAGRLDRREHPLRYVLVGLAPARRERVAQHPPVARVTQRPVADAERLALEPVDALQQPVVKFDGQLELRGDRFGRLLHALQRRGDDVRDVALGERLGGRRGHLPAQLGELVAGQAAIKNLRRVVHLAVAQDVNDRPHVSPSDPAAAARAAAGSAAAIASSASASMAALTNHASNALGGRYTPPASIAWKNALNAPTSWVLACSKLLTGASVK